MSEQRPEHHEKVSDEDVDRLVQRLEEWGAQLPDSERALLSMMLERGTSTIGREGFRQPEASSGIRVSEVVSATLKEVVAGRNLFFGYGPVAGWIQTQVPTSDPWGQTHTGPGWTQEVGGLGLGGEVGRPEERGGEFERGE